MRTFEEWKHLFRKIGVEKPEEWASAEHKEKLGNLISLAFLRELKSLVPGEKDKFWLSRWVSYEAENQEIACAAYKRLVASGTNQDDMQALIRGVMSEFTYQVASLLDEGEPRDLADEVKNQIQWRFCELSEENKLKVLSSLHELVDEQKP